MIAQEASERELLAIEAALNARAFCWFRHDGEMEGHFGFTKAEVAIIQSAFAAARAARDAPVAWRTYALFNGDSGDGDWIIETEIDTEQKQSGKWQPLYAVAPFPRPERSTESSAPENGETI